MIYQARTEANELFIAMYETEEPIRPVAFMGQGAYLEELYHKAIQQWQSSKREYKVRDEDKDAIKEQLFYSFGGIGEFPPKARYQVELFSKALEKGIDCTFLKDRLKLEKSYPKTWPYDEQPQTFEEWTLLPLEDKKENEAVEFAEWIRENNYVWHVSARFKPSGYAVRYKNGPRYSTAELYQIFKNLNKQ